MAHSWMKRLFATAAVVTLSVGAMGVASAAPVAGMAVESTAQAAASHGLTQSVRWVVRGHRRVWVADRPVRRAPPRHILPHR